jgi:alanine racemase
MQSIIENKNALKPNTWIEISKSNLLFNLAAIKKMQRPHTKVIAVVKANAYGHGLLEVSDILSSHVDYLAITSLREVEILQKKLSRPKILLLSSLFPEEVPAAVESDIALTISSFEEARLIAKASQDQRKTTTIHIKVDTGMGRLGIPLSDAVSQIEMIAKLPALDLEGIYTHFPSADFDPIFTQRQINDFSLLVRALEKKEIHFSLRHTSNSAGCVQGQNVLFNAIRPGLSLYGYHPHVSLKDKIILKPILSLKSRILLIKRLAPGQSVGYAQKFIATDPCTIAILPLGYSSGYPFRAAEKGKVIFREKKFSFAGRISMDYVAIALEDQYAVPHDEMVLIGKDGQEEITADDIASWAGTLSYEILTNLSPTITRKITE